MQGAFATIVIITVISFSSSTPTVAIIIITCGLDWLLFVLRDGAVDQTVACSSTVSVNAQRLSSLSVRCRKASTHLSPL